MEPIQKARRRAILRRVQDAEELHKAIGEVAPKANTESRKKALSELKDAIASFRQAHPYVEGDYRVGASVGDQRKALARLSRSLQGSIESIKALPPHTHASLSRRLGPIGKMMRKLGTWIDAVRAEHQAAVKSEDHPDNHETTVLAFEVARILRDTLKGKIALSSDRSMTHAARNGAAYARLLRSTLEASGANTPDDLLPIMKKGKVLLMAVSPADEDEGNSGSLT